MRIFSTFTGIGGFEIGIQRAFDNRPNLRNGAESIPEDNTDTTQPQVRAECVGYSEIDKYACSVFEKHNPGVPNYGDITKINANELPDFDCLVGGFPCQAFSIAGKRKGFDDTRGTLFFDLARILRAKRPRLFVFENVKGLLSHDNGNTFRTIIATIDELGYDCQWQVINSKNHGVPQNRERIILVGHLRGTSRPEVFPFGEESGSDCKIVGRATGINGHDYLKRIYSPEGSSPTLPTGTGGNHEGKFEIDSKIRRLTPVECERLQGFPDDWTKEGVEWCLGERCTRGKMDACLGHFVEISDTQRYKMCGNAVTTNVIQAVFERILDVPDKQ